MGLRGSPPTPNSILKLRNSRRLTRKDRAPLNANDAMGCDSPESPVQLDAKESKIWDIVKKACIDLRVLTVADGPALLMLVDVLGRYIKVRSAESDSDYDRVLRQLVMLTDRFGLNPAARGRVVTLASESNEENPTERYLKAGAI